MAQRRSTSSTRSSGETASKGSGEAAASPGPDEGKRSKRSKPEVVHAGGHVIKVDPPTPTPEAFVQCSVCGAGLEDGACPNGHGVEDGGWGVEDGS